MKKLLYVIILATLITFTACNKKNQEKNKAEKKTNTQKELKKEKKEKKKETKKQAEKTEKKQEKKQDYRNIKAELKKSNATQEQIDKLSEIFAYGDKLIAERKKIQDELKELSKGFKEISTPFLLKKDSKYNKYTSITYFTNSVWTTVYSDPKKDNKSKLFWIIVTYKNDMDEKGRKSYRSKFAGYPATNFKDAWAWVLLKGDIEIKISAYNSVKNDKAIEEVLKSFDLKTIEHIFDKKTKTPKLRDYLLKVKELKAKISKINKKFSEKEKEAVEALKPFLNEGKGAFKDMDLTKIKFDSSNTFAITVQKDKKTLFNLYIGRPNSFFGALGYFAKKDGNFAQIGHYKVAIVNESLMIVKLPTLLVKTVNFYKNEYQDPKKLVKILSDLDLEGLAKVK